MRPTSRARRERRATSVGPEGSMRFDRTRSRVRGRDAARASSVMPFRDTSIGPAYYSNRDAQATRTSSDFGTVRPHPSPPVQPSFEPRGRSSFDTSFGNSPSPSRPASRPGSRRSSLTISRHELPSPVDGSPLPLNAPAYSELTRTPLDEIGSAAPSATPSDGEGQPGTRSAPIPSSVRSSLEHLPLEPSEVAAPSARTHRPSFSSRPAHRPSLSPAPSDRQRDRSKTPISKRRKDGEQAPHARFSLGQLSDVLRGKSKTRAPSLSEEPEHVSKQDRSVSRGRSKGLKALREALVEGMHENGSIQDPLDSDEEVHGDDQKAVGWREFKVGFLSFPSLASPNLTSLARILGQCLCLCLSAYLPVSNAVSAPITIA
jgi:hypothetical protein